MKNDIKEDYCSFEVSKLLKEKDFTQPTLFYYFEDGELRENKFIETTGMDYGIRYTVEYIELLDNWNNNYLTKKNGDRCLGCSKSKGYFETYSAPTHALAIKWIRENFGIHIWIENNAFGYYWTANNSSDPKFWVKDFRAKQGSTDLTLNIYPEKEYKLPKEAIEAALLYTLKNLIL